MLKITASKLYLREDIILNLPELNISAGEVLTLMGASGCGKSSFLAALAGVLPAKVFRLDAQYWLNNKELSRLSPQQRKIGILFQDDLLFPHLSIVENLIFGMPHNIKGLQRKAKALKALAEVDLKGCENYYPEHLSGGQKARVSLLRTLLSSPQALLLDEPFAKLDKPLRKAFRSLVFEHIQQRAIPAILVTHDEEDAPAHIINIHSANINIKIN